MNKRIKKFLLFLFFMFSSSLSWAHVELLGNMEGRVNKEKIDLVITLPEKNMRHNRDFFQNNTEQKMSFLNNGLPCSINLKDFTIALPTTVILEVVCKESIGVLSMHSEFMLNDGYKFSVNMVAQEVSKIVVLNDAQQDAEFDFSFLKPKENIVALNKIVKEYVIMGMKHIYEGYDHVLFVLALILVSPQFWSLVKTATAFTVAHSITLILSTLNIIHVSPDVIEPIIAFSIAYVAFEDFINRYRNKLNPTFFKRSRRWIVVFCFGLFHGLGFSGALTEINISRAVLIPALLFFNLGVEFAQISIIACVFPFLCFLNKFSWQMHFVQIFLFIIGLLGIIWFFQRVLG